MINGNGQCVNGCIIMLFAVSPKENLSKAAVFVSDNRQAIKSKFADFQTNVCEKFE